MKKLHNFLLFSFINLFNTYSTYKYFKFKNKKLIMLRYVLLAVSSLMFINYVILSIVRYRYETNIKER